MRGASAAPWKGAWGGLFGVCISPKPNVSRRGGQVDCGLIVFVPNMFQARKTWQAWYF